MPKATCKWCGKDWIHWDSLSVPSLCKGCQARMDAFNEVMKPVLKAYMDSCFPATYLDRLKDLKELG